MGRLPRCAMPAELGAGVGLRRAPKAAMATGESAVLVAVQPAAASGATLLTVGRHAVCVLRPVLVDVPSADGPAGVVTCALP